MQTRHLALAFALGVASSLASPVAWAQPIISTPAAHATNAFHPVPLDAFYQRLFASYRPTDSWALVPRGLTNFDGVPFRMFGKIDMTGLGRARDGEFQPARVGEIPLGRRAARLHLIHGAGYDAPNDTPISCVRLLYTDGEDRKLFIRYGVHVRNWYVERSERSAVLRDPRSTVIWNGNIRPDGTGTPLRLFKSSFDNPRPGDEIRAVEFLSLFARANSVVLAITFEEAASPNAVPAQPTEAGDDSDLRREMLVRTQDAATGRAASNIVATLQVGEGGRNYRFGTYRSDAHGQILLDYPPGVFQRFTLSFNGDGYAPFTFSTNSEEGIYVPELPVRMVRP